MGPIMAASLRSLASTALRHHVTAKSTNVSRLRSFGSSSRTISSGFGSFGTPETLVKALGAGLLLAGSAATTTTFLMPMTTAKCEVKVDKVVEKTEEDVDAAAAESAAAVSKPSLHDQAKALYSDGRLADVYELLNQNPSTKKDAQLLFRLAQTTHKMSLTAPQPERRRVLNDEALLVVMKAAEEAGKVSDNKSDRADILALYGTVIQHRAHRKQEGERKQLMALAQEHMVAALREDAANFHANSALADLHYEMAQERTELGRKSLVGIAIWDRTNNNKLSETDQESLWRTTARHAFVALKSKPDDLNTINHMAQAKFAIGDLAAAKTYTLRAMAAEKNAKFVDEKQAAKDCKDLMDRINALLGEKQ